jgi:hypothetical protein
VALDATAFAGQSPFTGFDFNLSGLAAHYTPTRYDSVTLVFQLDYLAVDRPGVALDKCLHPPAATTPTPTLPPPTPTTPPDPEEPPFEP